MGLPSVKMIVFTESKRGETAEQLQQKVDGAWDDIIGSLVAK